VERWKGISLTYRPGLIRPGSLMLDPIRIRICLCTVDSSKSYWRIWTKSCRMWDLESRKKWLNFETDLILDPLYIWIHLILGPISRILGHFSLFENCEIRHFFDIFWRELYECFSYCHCHKHTDGFKRIDDICGVNQWMWLHDMQ